MAELTRDRNAFDPQSVLASIPDESTPLPAQLEEPPSWKEIKDSEEYKALNYPQQYDLARKWGQETKDYASTLPDFNEEQAKQIDDFVDQDAVDVPANVRMAAGAAGLIKGGAGLLGGIAGGAGGFAVGGPVGGVAGAVGGSILASQAAEAGLQKFTPNVARAREFAPVTAGVAEYVPAVAMGGVGFTQLAKTGKVMFQELGKKKAAEELAKYGGAAGFVGGGVGTGVRAITGQDVSPWTIAEDVLFGIAFAGLGANARVKGYTREQALSLNERVKAKQATPEEFRDWNSILAEAQAKQVRGVESAKITEATLGGRPMVSKTELRQAPPPEPTTVRPLPTGELPAPRPEVLELPESGIRGNVRGTQADTAEMLRREIPTNIQQEFLDLNAPAPRKEVFSVESQGINREAITPDIRGLQGELVREGPIVTPRTVLPSTERLALEEPKQLEPIEPIKESEFTIKAFHGTPSGGFEKFKGRETGIYFTDKKSIAQEYTRERGMWLSPGKNPQVIEANLRIKNPLEIDAMGARNNNIPIPGKEWKPTVFGRLPKNSVSVDDAAKMAFEQGYDGLIVKNVKDSVYNDTRTNSTVYVVKSTEQIAQPQKPTIPRPMGGKGQAGFVVSDPIEGARDFIQKWATTEGNLPKEVFDMLESKDQRISAMKKQIDNTLLDLKRATKLENNKAQLTPEQKTSIDAYMRGDVEAIKSLPESIRNSVVQMRRQIDNLSQGLINSGVFTEGKAQAVAANVGQYLTRSYEKYDNPKFNYELIKQRDPQRFAAAMNFVKNEIIASNPDITMEQANLLTEGKVRELSQSEEGFSIDSLMRASNLGKDLSVTKTRKNIPDEIRFLMGEYEDPVINYARTAIKLINLFQAQKTLSDLRGFGLQNKLFFEKPTGTASRLIAAEGSETFSPLNGLYAEPELVEALKGFESTIKGGELFRLFAMANAWVKWGKTVGSIQAQFRNPMANVLIEIQNGNFLFTGGAKALRVVLSELGIPKADTPELRTYITRATQLGVLDTTVLNEFYQTLKDAQQYKGTAMNFAEDIAGKSAGFVGKGLKGGIGILNKIYRSGDNFFKLTAWESETKMLMDGAGLPRNEAEVQAAEIVKNTRPTYSRVIRFIKRWRNQPLFGQFMSWPAEILRTTPNSIRYASKYYKQPGMRKYAFIKMAGMLTAISATAGVVRAFMWATGFNDRKVDALRRFVAPYQRNASLAPTGSEGGKVSYIDISYTDPHSVFMQPITAVMNGRDVEEGILEATRSFLESYIGPSILANSVASAIYGKTPQNREIRNPQDPAFDQFWDTLAYAVRQNEPSTVSQIRRVIYSLTGKPDVTVSKYGRVYEPSEELAAMLGTRPQSINISKSLQSKSSRFATQMSDVSRIFTDTYGAVGKVDEATIREQYGKMDSRRRVLFDEANKDFHAAMLLGLTRSEAINSMRVGNMGTANAIAVANNKYRDYKVSKSLVRQMKKELEPAEMIKRQAITRELQMQSEM